MIRIGLDQQKQKLELLQPVSSPLVVPPPYIFLPLPPLLSSSLSLLPFWQLIPLTFSPALIVPLSHASISRILFHLKWSPFPLNHPVPIILTFTPTIDHILNHLSGCKCPGSHVTESRLHGKEVGRITWRKAAVVKRCMGRIMYISASQKGTVLRESVPCLDANKQQMLLPLITCKRISATLTSRTTDPQSP